MQVNLVMFRSDGQRKDFQLVHSTTTIGRRQDCHLRIPLSGISRRHCELILTTKEVKVKDLASSNGTYVNNKRVNEQALKAGDRLSVGAVVFTVQINGRPMNVKPVQPAQPAGLGEDEVAVELAPSDEDPISALEALARENDDDAQRTKT